MQTYSIISPGEVEVSGTRIFLDHGDNDSKFRNKRRSDAYYMAKSMGYIEAYHELGMVEGFVPKAGMNMLEVGIFAGGSSVFFDRYYDLKRLVALDFMTESAPALDRYATENGGGRIASYYGVDQSDKARVKMIIDQEFDGPLDIVVDDASHFYRESRATFETVFPYLRPGGLYILEDWTWAHAPSFADPSHPWADQDALTNLVQRFVMTHATDMGVIRRLGCTTGLTWVQKGWNDLPKEGWSLEPFERPRGRELNLI